MDGGAWGGEDPRQVAACVSLLLPEEPAGGSQATRTDRTARAPDQQVTRGCSRAGGGDALERVGMAGTWPSRVKEADKG